MTLHKVHCRKCSRLLMEVEPGGEAIPDDIAIPHVIRVCQRCKQRNIVNVRTASVI